MVSTTRYDIAVASGSKKLTSYLFVDFELLHCECISTHPPAEFVVSFDDCDLGGALRERGGMRPKMREAISCSVAGT
jgi:hypothetical protein